MAGLDGVDAEVFPDPAQHLGRRELQRLVEWAPGGDDQEIGLRLAARPEQLVSLAQLDAEFDLERGLDAGTGDLAVALAGMAVAEEEQPARRMDREGDGRAGAEQAIVHIAAMGAARRGRDRLAAFGRDAEAAEHRRQWEAPVADAGRGLQQLHRAGLGIDRPFMALALRQLGEDRRVKHAGRQRRIGPAGLPGRRHPLDRHQQRVAGLGAGHEERAGHRIAARRPLRALVIGSGGVERRRDDAVAAGDLQHGGQGADHVVILRRLEVVARHGGPSAAGANASRESRLAPRS